MPDTTAHHELVQTLRNALRHLYDPIHTANSELIALLGLSEADVPAMQLQSLLMEAIEALKPDATVAPDASQWSHYHLLSQRYVEQFTPDDVALNLSVSPRTYRRLHSQALQALANHLLAERGMDADVSVTEGDEADATEAARAQELGWLKSASQPEAVDVLSMLDGVLDVVAPMFEQDQAEVQWSRPNRLPMAAVRPVALQHALTSLLTTLAPQATQGMLRITTTASGNRIIVAFEPVGGVTAEVVTPEDEAIRLAGELVRVAGGQFRAMPAKDGALYSAAVVLFAAERMPVLVIDDNTDTLRLYERFMAGGRYRFEGCSDPVEAMALVPQIQPVAIILDLMLPGMDGWTVLRNLRESAHGREIPIIVSSILPQEDLALTLGATAFLRKPVSQEALVTALEEACTPRA